MRPKHLLAWIPLLVVFALVILPWGPGCSSTPSAPVTVTQIVVATPPATTLAGRDWNFTTLSAPFSNRYEFGSVVFNNQMLVFGGTDCSAYIYNDVWSSTDGTNWTKLLANNASPGPNQFSRRQGFTSLVYNNKIWVIGGYPNGCCLNDVWSSSDGVSWNNVLANNASPGPNQFSQRRDLTSLVFNNKMWVISGTGLSGYKNDVWSSSNGVSWTQVLADTASPGTYQFSERSGLSSVAYNGTMFVMGGGKPSLTTYYNDVWGSTDGITWYTYDADTASPGPYLFSRRNGQSTLTYGGAIWLIGGSTHSSIFNDVWFSTDGISWSEMTASAPFPARSFFGSLSYNNDLWAIGGIGAGCYGDVWHSPF
jgi:hypothetical protein